MVAHRVLHSRLPAGAEPAESRFLAFVTGAIACTVTLPLTLLRTRQWESRHPISL